MADPAMGGDDKPAAPRPTPPAPATPAPAEPAMGDGDKPAPPAPVDPAMGDGKPAPDPGMADPSGPGMGDAPPDGGDTGGDPTLVMPMRIRAGLGGAAALEKALKAAFAGVDWAEFEAAWRESMSKVSG